MKAGSSVVSGIRSDGRFRPIRSVPSCHDRVRYWPEAEWSVWTIGTLRRTFTSARSEEAAFDAEGTFEMVKACLCISLHRVPSCTTALAAAQFFWPDPSFGRDLPHYVLRDLPNLFRNMNRVTAHDAQRSHKRL
jgi:hypothetical protein